MVFQSHLYGIEREALGLNPSRVVEFQSHLYGIESVVQVLREIIIGVSIAPLWNWKWTCRRWAMSQRRFNRTFMELKVCVGTQRMPSRSRFQSHLYGIESSRHRRRVNRPRVSIAPLWNWKTFRPRTARWPCCFNRTFMELKVTFIVRRTVGVIVSIAPLWNWKSGRAAISANSASFNRTFMELKAWISK